ncbi:hypothetical protein ACWEKM_18720 [Streptomyces sp. NPDC004752]
MSSSAALRRVRPGRRPAPVMDSLVAADERRFSELCRLITHVRQGAEQ